MQVKILFYLIFLLGGYRAGGKGVCGRLMSPAHESQSMREIRLLRGRLPRKGGGLTGMPYPALSLTLIKPLLALDLSLTLMVLMRRKFCHFQSNYYVTTVVMYLFLWQPYRFGLWFRFMVFNATFNNISVILWRSVLLMGESSVHRV